LGVDSGYPDGYLVPFCHGSETMAAVFLGFKERSVFHPEDPAFILWRSQVEAALHGLHCIRARLAEQAKALGGPVCG
jgi:hypothetical protein